MSLRRATATPFRDRGTRSLPESEFVVALSLDRDWFSPDQAKRLIDRAVADGLLERTEKTLEPTFDVADVEIPHGYQPDESVLRGRSAFEQLLEAMTAAGLEKRTAVAETNKLQEELGVTLEAAAVIHAQREDVDIREIVTGMTGFE
ncbi:MAG: DUF2240 family protein [Salinirussus sp.]